MPIPSIEDQEEFWDGWNKTHRGTKIDSASKRRRDEILRIIEGLNFPNPQILEVGCANGWLCAELAQYGRVMGTDLSSASIRQAKERYPQLRFEAGDFTKIRLDELFDIVVCVESLGSVADHETFIGGMANVLQPCGCLILTTQNPIVFSRDSGLQPVAPGQIRNWANQERLRALLAPRFSVELMYTVNPGGDRGFLRWVNAPKLTRLFGSLMGARNVEKLKEVCGLGQTIIVKAAKLDQRAP